MLSALHVKVIYWRAQKLDSRSLHSAKQKINDLQNQRKGQ